MNLLDPLQHVGQLGDIGFQPCIRGGRETRSMGCASDIESKPWIRCSDADIANGSDPDALAIRGQEGQRGVPSPLYAHIRRHRSTWSHLKLHGRKRIEPKPGITWARRHWAVRGHESLEMASDARFDRGDDALAIELKHATLERRIVGIQHSELWVVVSSLDDSAQLE